ncbi:D-alanine aminotransferase [Thiomonas arsenitoxydans]|uniref:branched-chain-amino-acid transaminase n=1 Tax=Thiomonas arsenitoxydans (strain DSM 22701 / CIP 110005 / 3As) TaxID=426114 RepID=D6CNA6_THIA3|nr:D-amino acid aminotransferase [Thiomonas arsenitoxydans]CAZ90034.1 putative Aminotransferase, class IV [Thiomonas arsenitoxydans]CQR37232.1 D-alanine aminotransferase [Thiomonas arsenitoxydans]CQR38329.1 D-alanine aminotransferase [Thiomonas arsenitoxydans]CQR40287.1 D-alanine aminotransferase [Thiomonas arsenitoxydans]CQR40352.1 D-alanine aminotransferase [Thiomonas arsenitoxydans]
MSFNPMSTDQSECYLNGVFQPLAQCQVSVLDRGFIFGDGVYEVIPVYGRRVFRADDHLARLSRSLDAVGIKNPSQANDWLALVRELIARNAPDDQCIYIQVTRGVAKRDHAFPQGVEPTVFMMSFPFPHVPEQKRAQGVACITAPDLRWRNAHIKSISLLGNVLARQLSVESDATETVLIRDGLLTEASASNVWLVRNGRLAAPLRDHDKLEGIRVGLLQELCGEIGVKLEFRPISEWELRCADEILLTSATKEVLSVATLDGKAVGQGKPGPVATALYSAYQEAKKSQSH